MSSSKRQLLAALRRAGRAVNASEQAIGNCPSTSYNIIPGHSLSALRRPWGIRQVWLSQSGGGRQASWLLRREAEIFAQQLHGFKTAAFGSGVGVTQNGQTLLTALLPPALLWLFMVLPNSLHALAFKLCGFGVGAAQQKQHGSFASSAVDPSGPSLHLPPIFRDILDELLLMARAMYLCLLFLPALITAPFVSLFGGFGRERWLLLVQWTLERAGPAFIKWGQWASTRPDLFPEDLCFHLEQLQTSAPAHSPAATLQVVQRAFQEPIAELFDDFELEPVASGSIAQVHLATLSSVGASRVGCGAEAGTRVAVKVRHPGVSEVMHRDFILMQRAAALCSRLPALAELRLEESIRQFGGPLKEQLDLGVEASHLQRFNDNFKAWDSVRFPVPLHPLVSSDVLVESYEEGDLIMRYVRNPHRHNAILAITGVTAFLQMMLRDNFIHADLHPGNIIVKEADPPSPWVARAAAWMPDRVRSWLTDRAPQVVLLDTGMIVELSEWDRSALLGFFRALTKMDGQALAREILNMSVDGACKDGPAFAAELESLFRNMDREYMRLESQAVIRDIIERMRQHQVTLRSSVSTVVVTSLVLEGWSSKLDPDIRILETMRDMLATDWADRISLTVDRIVGSGQLVDV